MAAITQTIAIFDRSNKVVSTSKQLKNVFKEAKMAYLERKAEIIEARRSKEDKDLRKSTKGMTLANDANSEVSRRSRRHRSHRKENERPMAGGQHHSSGDTRRIQPYVESEVDGPRYADDPHARHVGLAEFNDELYGHHRSAPTTPHESPRGHELVRRTTDLPLQTQRQHRPTPARSHSVSEIDMDLAYGDFHHESLMLDPRTEQKLQKQEMSSLVLKCKMLMEEANCAQHSVRAMILHLQQHPDAMAAVALTLAEISNLASKMAPGVLMAFKTGAPGVFAMLAAPEFLIAVGVGVGITVVMFGGYKIIKKIKARVSDKEDDAMEEMLDVKELDRIDHWRRGIADDETASIATSVEGEFITPMAARSMGHLPMPGARGEERAEEHRKGDKRKKSPRKMIEADPDGTVVGSDISSASRRSRSSKSEKREKVAVKVKKPSTLRRMFTSKDTEVSSRR